jgi:hypothetical protein
MGKSTSTSCIEPRWPAVLAILVVLGLLMVLPDRVSLFPDWVPPIIGIVLLVPMATVSLTAAKARWLRIEYIVIRLFLGVAGVGNLVSLSYLINEMLNRSKALDGLQLLTSSIAVWVTNVLVFSLLYWQIDRGGPEARANHQRIRPDWLFPQEGLSEDVVPPDWCPIFVDYLALAFTTAMAFSPADAMPLTHRAKLLMILESTIALTTIVVVLSRAIGILGS